MRQARWFSLCGVLLAGCVGVDSDSTVVDVPPTPRPRTGPPPFSTATGDTTEPDTARPKAKADAPPQPSEQNALSKCLPSGLNLSMTVCPPDGPPFVLQKRLAEIGARRRTDGLLVDAKGNVISTRGEVLRPQTQMSVQATDPEEESRKFLETLLTPAQVARWRELGRPMRVLWSFEKDAYDRVMLFPEDFGVSPTRPSIVPPPNPQRP